MLREEDLITPALLKRFQAEAEIDGNDGHFYALIRRDNGDFLAHHPGSPPLVPEQTMWACDVLRRINRELHHDGAWVIVFTDPAPVGADEVMFVHSGHAEYGRYALLWADEDADVQFAVEWVRNESEVLDWTDVLMAGIESVMGKCETAWTLWNTHMREVLDPAEGQTFKRARGQQAAPTRH